jgi:hypothetical protein
MVIDILRNFFFSLQSDRGLAEEIVGSGISLTTRVQQFLDALPNFANLEVGNLLRSTKYVEAVTLTQTLVGGYCKSPEWSGGRPDYHTVMRKNLYRRFT